MSFQAALTFQRDNPGGQSPDLIFHRPEIPAMKILFAGTAHTADMSPNCQIPRSNNLFSAFGASDFSRKDLPESGRLGAVYRCKRSFVHVNRQFLTSRHINHRKHRRQLLRRTNKIHFITSKSYHDRFRLFSVQTFLPADNRRHGFAFELPARERAVFGFAYVCGFFRARKPDSFMMQDQTPSRPRPRRRLKFPLANSASAPD